MLNLDELMRKATPEQRMVLSKLKELVGEEKRLMDEARFTYRGSGEMVAYPRLETADDNMVENALANNSDKIPFGTKQRLIDVKGRIKRTVEEAARYGVLVVPYNNLK